MTTILIKYNELTESANNATGAALRLDDYADCIPNVITNQLSNLSGDDSNGYVGSAIELANQKADSLREKAQEYRSYSGRIETFVENAKDADQRVSQKMDSLAHENLGDSPWDQICYYLNKLYNDTIGSTELGAFIDNCISGVTDWCEKWTRKAFDWFVHGNGQYVLNIAISVLGTAAAIAGAVILFPVSGVFAAVVAGLAIYSAGVSVINSVLTIADNCKAISLNDTDPGLARYYGKTSNISDFANKHTENQFLQSAASALNTSGEVAGLLSSLGSGFTKELKDGTKIGSFSWDTIKGNFSSKFGFEFNQDLNKWKFKPQKLFGGSSHSASDGWTNMPDWFRNAERINNFSSGTGTILSTFSDGLSIVHDKEISLQTGLGMLSNVFPAAGDVSNMISIGN